LETFHRYQSSFWALVARWRDWKIARRSHRFPAVVEGQAQLGDHVLRHLDVDFTGQLDLSAALLQQIPRGTIVGKYSARGEKNSIMDGYKVQGAFQGVFRIPFLHGEQRQPSYLLDDGTVVPLARDYEYSIGQPTPRLEVTFTSKK
jgi:hypothetical protein